MTSRLHGRVAQLEAADKPPPSFGVFMPPELLHAPEAQAAAIAEHRARTGYTGPVMIFPRECETVEEWERLCADERRA